jgi:2-polyprenyl-3-methyl-5-hydroxy-6-metoxy-1,4-benzoquinol methylase
MTSSSVQSNIRTRLKKINWILSFRYFIADVLEMFGSPHRHVVEEWEQTYKSGADPQDYASDSEQRRYADAISLLNPVAMGKRFRSVLDVGCGEGLFTQRLVSFSDQIVATDIVPLPLERARQRISSGVTFRTLDLLNDEIGAKYQLVVALGVLECLKWPSDVRKAASKLVDATEPNGFLLVANTVRADPVEQSRWGRLLLRGTHISQYLASLPQLEVIASAQCTCLRGDVKTVLLRKKL